MHGFDELNSVVGGYYRLLLGFTGLYWVLKSFLYRLSPGCTRYVNVFLNLIRFRVLKLFFSGNDPIFRRFNDFFSSPSGNRRVNCCFLQHHWVFIGTNSYETKVAGGDDKKKQKQKETKKKRKKRTVESSSGRQLTSSATVSSSFSSFLNKKKEPLDFVC